MVIDDATVSWLMDGDPVIRWQTQRDLLDEAESVWSKERRKTVESGWGAGYLAAMTSDLTWPAGRWTDTVWTLLVIMDCGLPADHPPLLAAARRFIDKNLTAERASNPKWLMTRMDLCHLGFWLRIGSYFLGRDQRLTETAKTVVAAQMADGGFNCHIRNHPETRHSSFHTTFNVLEGLAAAAKADVISAEAFRAVEAPALAFMLAHRMYRSDRTGEVISERFTHLSHPSHWHYTVLRGLDHMRHAPEIADPRLDEPVALLASRRKSNGRWPVEKRIPGTEHFDMEKPGSDSRWNTLRVLRVLKAREGARLRSGAACDGVALSQGLPPTPCEAGGRADRYPDALPRPVRQSSADVQHFKKVSNGGPESGAAALAQSPKADAMTRRRTARTPAKESQTDGARKAAATRSKGAAAAAAPTLLAGGNPQIAKGYGDAPVQAYIAAMPGWKSDVGRRLDALIAGTVPGVRKAVKWNSPFYGIEGQGWFLSFHCFTNYVKVAFFRGTSLHPVPPGKSKQRDVRYLDIREGDPFDEAQFAAWVKQASQLPGERM